MNNPHDISGLPQRIANALDTYNDALASGNEYLAKEALDELAGIMSETIAEVRMRIEQLNEVLWNNRKDNQ